MSKCYWVYKITIKGFKLFYIGVTNDIDKRRVWHLSRINSEINRLRVLKNYSNNKGHAKVASALHNDNPYLTIRELHKLVKVSTLYLIDSEEETAKVENKLLQQHKDNPDCFNLTFTSSYFKRKKKNK